MTFVQIGAYHLDLSTIAYVYDGRGNNFNFVSVVLKGSTDEHPLTITLTKEDDINRLFQALYGLKG